MKKILFSGTSHTFGLGLELEFRPKYQDEKWLKENFTYPNPREKSDKKYWYKYRWPTLVCDELGYEQFNISDDETWGGFGGDAVETIYNSLILDEKTLDDVKYVILQLGGIRWYERGKHDININYPNTVGELLNMIDSPPKDLPKNYKKVVRDGIKYFYEWDAKQYHIDVQQKFHMVQEKFPNVKFLILQWDSMFEHDNEVERIFKKGNDDDDYMIKLFLPKPVFIDPRNYQWPAKILHMKRTTRVNCVSKYIGYNKLTIGDVAKYYEVLKHTNIWKDEHANHKGHIWVAEQVVKHIKWLESNDK